MLSATRQPDLEISSRRSSLCYSCSQRRPGLLRSSLVLRCRLPRRRWQDRRHTMYRTWPCPVPQKGPWRDGRTLGGSRWTAVVSGTRRRTICSTNAYRSLVGRTAGPHTRSETLPLCRHRWPHLHAPVESERTCHGQLQWVKFYFVNYISCSCVRERRTIVA